MLVIGDLHLMRNWIKKQQVENFFEWLHKQDCFTKEKNIVFLGDLFEIPCPDVSLVVFYLQVFSKIWKDKTIYLLEGNHDHNLTENALDYFTVLDNVKLIKDLQELEIEGRKCLFLPDYSYEGTDKLPMEEYYSSLKGEYDYIFAHVMDETQNFGSKFCDLKNVKGKRLFGHIHTSTLEKGGNYLGSAVKNSSTEKDDNKVLALINADGLKLVQVPSFLEYETVNYGDEPNCKDNLLLLNVTGAPSKAEAEEFYEAKFKNIKLNKVTTKRQLILSSEAIDEVSESASWEAFSKEKKLPETVDAICRELL